MFVINVQTIFLVQWAGMDIIYLPTQCQNLLVRQTRVSGTAIFKNWTLICDYSLNLGSILLNFL